MSISCCPKISKNRRKRGYFLGKTPFLSPFLHFFKKIELFRRKTVRINIFPGGIKNSAKKKGQSHFAQKKVKKGYFLGQNSIFELVFTFFQKNRVVSQKDSLNKHIPWRNKKICEHWPKKQGSW